MASAIPMPKLGNMTKFRSWSLLSAKIYPILSQTLAQESQPLWSQYCPLPPLYPKYPKCHRLQKRHVVTTAQQANHILFTYQQGV